MTRKALVVLAALVVAGAVFVGFKTADKPILKDDIIISVVNDALSQFHFNPKPLNDQLSEEVMAEYLKTIDGNKLFLTRHDVDEIEVFKTNLDDEFKAGNSACFDVSYALLQDGIARAEQIYIDVLSKPFDFDVEETTPSDPESLAWAKDETELRDYWRKYLKWRVANRIYNKQNSREKDEADGESTEPWDFEKEEAAAREKERENIAEWFETLSEVQRIEWLGVYINALTQIFDPHTEYMPPKQQENFEERMTGQFEGIGAQLKKDGEYITIERIITGSASWRQGQLEPGDKILAVGQGEEEPVDVVGWRIDKAVKIIRGKKGSEVRLTVRKKDGSRVVIPIVRDVVELEATYARSAILGQDKKVGYIRLPQFYVDFYDKANNHNCAEDVKNEIIKLKEEGVEGIVFDLRNNGGGSLEAAIEIAGLFIERGPVVQVKTYNQSARAKQNRDSRVYWEGPLVILVNNYSASASEIFAAAMQDYGRALVIGTETTFGKGTVQNVLDLDNALKGSPYSDLAPIGALKITTEKFYRINGGTTQLEGVRSDIVLPNPYELIKTGEKEYPYALAEDKIASAQYSIWPHSQAVYAQAIANSKARIAADVRLQKNHDYALWLKQQDENQNIPLKYAAFKDWQDKAEAVSVQYKNINKTEDSTAVWPLAAQKLLFEADTVTQSDYQRWFKSLSTDLQLHEAINVVEDLKAE